MFFLIVTFACNTKPNPSDDGYNFLVKDDIDTLNFFFYPYYEEYLFMNKGNLDSVIFNKAAQKRLPGEYLMGLIEKDHFVNRFLAFKGEENSRFKDFNDPLEFFLHEEYNLKNYDVEIYNDYIDSTTTPISKHQMLVAVKKTTRDTLLFQELNIGQTPNYVTYSFITYKTWEDRDEMYQLFRDLVIKLGDSSKVEKHNRYMIGK